MFVFTCVCMYKEKGTFGLKIVIALMLKLCVDIIVCFSCFLLLTLFHKHALINQRRCTPAEGREVHQIGSQFGVKNGVLKLLTCWDINKSKAKFLKSCASWKNGKWKASEVSEEMVAAKASISPPSPRREAVGLLYSCL